MLRFACLAALLYCCTLSWARLTVCIDPGHPSEVGRGTQGKKLTEVRANWQLAKLLRAKLEKHGIRVVMTKSAEDKLVTNQDRAEKANTAKADLMVRLHCDASSGSGFTVYAPNQAGSIRGVRGPSAEVIRKSQACAKLFHKAMAALLRGKLRDNGLRPDQDTAVGSRHGALIGSIFSKVPVVLVEMVVLTNAKDEAFLLSAKGRSAMAEALAKGVLAALSDAGERAVAKS